MSGPHQIATSDASHPFSRRRFLAGASAATLAFSILPSRLGRAAEAGPVLNLGLIGCGGRGKWIADLFRKHGGYKFVATMDYFQKRADDAGDKLEVPAGQRFSGLNGHLRLLEQKLDAVVIESPSYFHPPQAAAAVEAGKHVFLAKPIAVDVPGCQSVEASGRKATAKKLCFLVDFQTRTAPAYQEVINRARKGELGRLPFAEAVYNCNLMFPHMDADLRQNPNDPEARLRNWSIDRVLSGDVITEQNIHVLDVATWFYDAAPLKAGGAGGKARDYIGNCWDHFAVVYHFPGDALLSFNSRQMGFGLDEIRNRLYGTLGSAETNYAGKVWIRTKDDAYNGDTPGLYATGAIQNIATFHESIAKGDWSNPTVAPSVRSNLTTILGRTACYKGGEVTWADMMRKAEKWEIDPKGLKA